MSDTEKIYWPGVSSKTYEYSIYEIGTSFKNIPGNYIYAGLNDKNKWFPAYIGQTSDLRERLSNHEKEPCAKKNGATHIHVHSSSENEQTRVNEETDLIKNFNPVCND